MVSTQELGGGSSIGSGTKKQEEATKVEAAGADGEALDGDVSDDAEDPKLEDVAPVQGALD